MKKKDCRYRVFLIMFGVFAVIAATSPQKASAQAADSVALLRRMVLRFAKQDSLQEANKRVWIGLSVGVRAVPQAGKTGLLLDAVINPIDSSLALDPRDKHDVTLSGVVTVFPWPKRHWLMRNLGFIVNINLANFSEQKIGVFNQRIEGGGGLTYRLCKEMALAFTYERVASRSLRSAYDNLLNKQIIVDGKPITAIDIQDKRFFVDDYLGAWSLKYVFFFKL